MVTDLIETRVWVDAGDDSYEGIVRGLVVTQTADGVSHPLLIVQDDTTGRLCTAVVYECYVGDYRPPQKKLAAPAPAPAAQPRRDAAPQSTGGGASPSKQTH